ncbi:hypothetical protein AGDE_14276 [Angomonas deanei]|uniref:Uncharacterized protein n=1 Tax=Angomonas deanei TaxID=59799 RepID=A0A7G2C7Q7_9TRYP|nr:hypothetical protein AGDE_14276 [Angomonas deanei]CAD2214022.1 hypothetical protein, conserved [Angomonas deanei]|eukprot:EPY21117.1 hypothetical protein AGDE_14276 [Angomonas deanei]
MTTSIKKVQQELAEALETKRNTLLDEFFNLSTCECDLIGLYKYCRVYRVPEDVRLSVLAYDAREELVLPDTLEKDVRGGTVEEFLEWMVVPLPKLGRVMGYFRGVVDFYVQYKHGTIPLPLFKSFCAGCGVKGGYCFTKDDLLTVTSVGTCLDYFTTVLPLLPGVTWVQFPDFGEYTLPEDRSTMTGGGSVGEFLATVVDLLPEPKCVRGFSKDLVDDYLAYKAGNISHDVLEAFCYNNKVIGLTVCPTKVISTGVHPVEFCETMLPILPTVNTIIVGERLDTIGWCAILPKRITGMDLRYCRDLKDFSPLLGMNQLTTVVYHDKTNPSFQTIMEALRNKGVSVELKEYGK